VGGTVGGGVGGTVPARRRWARPLVPAAAALAGLLLATAAASSGGIDLRSDRDRLPELVYREQQQAASLARQVQGQRLANDAISRSKTVGAAAAAARRQADALATQLGLTPAAGAGLTVALDDAPRSARRAAGAPTPTPDDLVVHQQDVQGVVNALWAGGARAMTLMGQRVTATTAVRCVGNTLLLHGAVYSPPFVVAAIGDQARLRAALDAAPGVQIFRPYVAAYGLVLSVTPSSGLRLPAFTGPVELSRARPSS
jgi:uncharacterized protein YlxW (UPF0749 family)